MWRIEKDIPILRKDLIRINYAKLKCELKKIYKVKAKGFNTDINELEHSISAKTLKVETLQVERKTIPKKIELLRTTKKTYMKSKLKKTIMNEQVMQKNRLNSGAICRRTS